MKYKGKKISTNIVCFCDCRCERTQEKNVQNFDGGGQASVLRQEAKLAPHRIAMRSPSIAL
jgi:hypothetical protein